MKAKTLVYKNTEIFVHIIDNEIFTCSLPELRSEKCTFDELINYYKSIDWVIDFTNMELKTVEIDILD